MVERARLAREAQADELKVFLDQRKIFETDKSIFTNMHGTVPVQYLVDNTPKVKKKKTSIIPSVTEKSIPWPVYVHTVLFFR